MAPQTTTQDWHPVVPKPTKKFMAREAKRAHETELAREAKKNRKEFFRQKAAKPAAAAESNEEFWALCYQRQVERERAQRERAEREQSASE